MKQPELITAENLVEKIEIPPQPKLLIAINKEAKRKECNFSSVADLICSDVGISSEVLKTANSPVFGNRRTIGSIQQAISLLGLSRTITLVRDVSLRQQLSNGLNFDSFWKDSFKMANACALIAKKTKRIDAEEAYTFGLFHNAGIPLLMLNFDNYSKTISQSSLESGPNATTLEDKTYKLNHAIVGYYLCSKWLLPEHICKAVFYHHRLQSALEKYSTHEQEFLVLLVILHTAHQVIDDNSSNEHNDLPDELQSKALQLLLCDADSYKSLIKYTRKQLASL